jgi:hypothetical protein
MPPGGYFFQFLNNTPPNKQPVVTIAVLEFLLQLFSVEGSPLTRQKIYFDAYMRCALPS